jgi:hypothetical protein
MPAHIVQPREARTQPVDPADSHTVLTAMGTFACGQSANGTFHVAAEAEVGSFASGLADDGRSETA